MFSALALFLLSPGSKAAPRPGGIGSAAAGQPGMEGEGMFSKILPGGAAEQAGKLGEGMYKCKVKNNKKKTRNLFSWKQIFYFFPPAISGFGKKFTSFFWGADIKVRLYVSGMTLANIMFTQALSPLRSLDTVAF